MSGYRSFLVPFDFSEHSRAVLAVAVDLAGRLKADLHLLHVVQPPIYAGAYGAVVPPLIDMSKICDAATRSLQEVADQCQDLAGNVEVHVVESTNVASTIREKAAELAADLIVMGTHGRTGIAHVFLGSVTERTLRHAPCPVVTVPVGEE